MESFDFLPIVHSMSGIRPETRTAIHASVEVSWKDQDGTVHDSPAWMEDKSPSGSCIRVKTPIGVGSTVKIKWRWEEYSGTVKYCRSDGGEYVLGIQRDIKIQAPPSPPAILPVPEKSLGYANSIPATSIQTTPNQQDNVPSEISQPVIKTADSPILLPSERADTPPSAELQTQQTSTVLVGKERAPMTTKWLDNALKRQKPEAPNGKTNGASVPGNWTPVQAAPAVVSQANSGGKERAKSQGDLQSIEDIYRVAGIINPRMGYSIGKVVAMLNSDHLRGLSSEAKRGAVLMALDAAGITMDELLQDARLRQNAIDSYEADQQKHFEEYWARKAEGNAQIQTEMERVTAQCLGRIKRNQDEVSLEKAAFAEWQRTKEQETERISEAVELCSNVPPAEPSGAALVALRDMNLKSKPA